jgi:F-type H+-transporting ATPase subunit delta
MNQAISTAVVEPYAEALMSLAKDSNLTERFGQDAATMLETLQSSPDLQAALSNPFVQPEAKKAILNQLFASQVDGYMLRFLQLLVDRRRIMFLDAICKQYQSLLRQLTNTLLAQVISTVELTESQRYAVVDKVKSMTGAAQVELETSIDPELIGGVIIKIGSQVLDASIRGQLRRLTNSLLSPAL